MKQIELSASGWLTTDDFFAAFLAELGSPGCHGYNLDALWDSITSDLNEVLPPFRVVVRNAKNVDGDIAALFDLIDGLFADVRRERGLDVHLAIV